MTESAGEETQLTGGYSTSVVRIGDTVHRQVGPHSPAVHALLRRLEEAGFHGAPRFLGTDELGREVLSYLPGEVALAPLPAAARSTRALDRCTGMLRDYHDATARVVAALADLPWALVSPGPAEVVCHNDIAPYNVVFSGDEPVGLIDFDAAGPGPRLDDVAYFAYRFAPLCSPENLADGGWPEEPDRTGRLRRICDGYSLGDERADVVDVVLRRIDDLRRSIAERAADDDPGVSRHLEEDHLGIYSRDLRYVERQRGRLLAAIGC